MSHKLWVKVNLNSQEEISVQDGSRDVPKSSSYGGGRRGEISGIPTRLYLLERVSSIITKSGTYITNEHKYLKYVFKDEYIKRGNFTLQTRAKCAHRSSSLVSIPVPTKTQRALLTPAHCAAAADCHVCRGTQNRHILPKRNSKFIVKYHSVVHARLPFCPREKDCSCRPATLSIYADWPAEDRDWTLSV